MPELSPFYHELFAALNRGLWMSVALIVPAACGGVAIGLLAGSCRACGPRWLRKLGNFYAALFRGTPLVVQLFVLYYGLPDLYMHLEEPLRAFSPWLADHLKTLMYLSPYQAAVLGFMLCSGAYQSEYVRGAFLSIKKGQYLGALALGFGSWQTLFCIILPQAFRRALHGCGNEIIYLIKYSSLAYIVTCMELTGEGKTIATEHFRFTEVFMAIALYYLALVSMAMLLLKKLEQRLAIPGFGNS